MGKPNFSDEFKRDAVARVSQRLGVSPHSLYAWTPRFAMAVSGDASKDAEIGQLKRELVRVTEERDILKKPPRIRQGCKVRYAFVVEHRDLFKVRSMYLCLRIQPTPMPPIVSVIPTRSCRGVCWCNHRSRG